MKSLEHIESFLVLSDCGSFTETAKRLYRSQPTITNQIQKLEEMMGSKLFNRSRNMVQLTKSGVIFLEYAQQMNRLMEEATNHIKSFAEQDVLSVYVSVYMSNYFFAEILNRYHKDNPTQLLEIHTHCYDDLKRSLMEGKTNFAFMPLYQEDEYIRDHFDNLVLWEEQVQLILPPDHPWVSRKTLYSRDLHNEKILLPGSMYFQKYVSDQLNENNIKVRFLQMSQFEMIKQGVKSRLGLAFLPLGAVSDEVRSGELVMRSVSGLQIRWSNGLVRRKKVKLTSAEADFCQIVENHFRLL